MACPELLSSTEINLGVDLVAHLHELFVNYVSERPDRRNRHNRHQQHQDEIFSQSLAFFAFYEFNHKHLLTRSALEDSCPEARHTGHAGRANPD